MEYLQSRPHILKLIRNISEASGIRNGEIKNIETNRKGEGYLGEIFFVSISDHVSKKQLDLVIKAAFKDEKVRKLLPIRKSFENESFAYTTLFPKFDKFLKSKGLVSDHYKFVPKCYRVSTENQSEIIILENLRTSGFELFDKHSIVDGEHVALIFKTYGHFHGISLAYKDQHPDEFQALSDGLNDICSDFLNNQLFCDQLKQLAKLIDDHFSNGENDDLRKTFQKYVTAPDDIFRESLGRNCKNSVIVHGDCWSNNMMFKYDETSKKPIDLRLLDLQLISSGNTVCDLSYALYSGASKEIFDKLDDYLSIYHQALSDIVRKLGSNPESLLSFEDLKNDWRDYAKFGFLMSLLVIRVKLTKQDDVLDLTDFATIDGPIEDFGKFDEEKYCPRVLDIIRHMYDYGAL